ncbi:hypothetical protein MTR67_020057 [Solanum verrucosum]|uniref:Uncharacterized protein n=1 Tax=Solanum verrucosum TaxID=315347 RepID=A0AAF0QPW4_SOLVR|nr:hypothetical protein MTR67_020057 [Solanum verrucosum]
MKWSEVTQPECNGALGFTNLTINNKCLLMKWLWSYGTGEQSLWKGMIKAKHGSKDNWSTNITNAPYGLGPWKFISKLGHDFSQKIHFKPGVKAHQFLEGQTAMLSRMFILAFSTLLWIKIPQFPKTEAISPGIYIKEDLSKTGKWEV